MKEVEIRRTLKKRFPEAQEGMDFLKKSRLRIVYSDASLHRRFENGDRENDFLKDQGLPYLVAQSDLPLSLRYDRSSVKSCWGSLEYTDRPVAKKDLALMILNLLGNYKATSNRDTYTGFSLPEGQAMSVFLNSPDRDNQPGWESALRLISKSFPGTVLWPRHQRKPKTC